LTDAPGTISAQCQKQMPPTAGDTSHDASVMTADGQPTDVNSKVTPFVPLPPFDCIFTPQVSQFRSIQLYIDQCIFIIGHRYNCVQDGCKKTYQSWSPSLLAALPRSVSAHFTHHLTYRSGLTDQVVSLMRSSFLHGVGPVPFANTIRTNHLRHYELLHVQYLEVVYAQLRSSQHFLLAKFKPFGVFDDRDGYAGFTPCASYYRDFYVNFMASHASEIDQHMAMLSAKILCIDHSFRWVP
jgi:hypothetical protein